MLRFRVLLVSTVVLGALLPSAPASAASGCSFSGTLSPGEEMSKDCVIITGAGPDANFFYSVQQSSIEFFYAGGGKVSPSSPDWQRFNNWFRISIYVQHVVTTANPTGIGGFDVVGAPLLSPDVLNRTACFEKKFTDLTGGDWESPAPTHSCRIGRVPPNGQRVFRVVLKFLDDGDQSDFGGLSFTEVYTAQVPACSTSRPCTPLTEL